MPVILGASRSLVRSPRHCKHTSTPQQRSKQEQENRQHQPVFHVTLV
jgi:hypothetical protein